MLALLLFMGLERDMVLYESFEGGRNYEGCYSVNEIIKTGDGLYTLLGVLKSRKHGPVFKFQGFENSWFTMVCSDPLLAEILAANAMKKLKEKSK